jgi:hypothetical protein
MGKDEEVVSLLREIRDAALAHQRYIEERDRKHNEYLDFEARRIQKQEQSQKRGGIVWLLILFALYLIVFAQFFR